MLLQLLYFGLELDKQILDFVIGDIVFEFSLFLSIEKINELIDFLLCSLLDFLRCFGPSWLFFLFVGLQFWQFDRLSFFGLDLRCIFKFLALLIAFLLDLFESLGSFFLFLFVLLLLLLDGFLEAVEPLLVVVEDGEHSFPCLSLVELLHRHKPKLLVGTHPPAKLSALTCKHLIGLVEGLSLGLEQSSTPL